VVPYIGDLVGTRGLFAVPDAAFSQRAQVANTIGYRRRKGTAAVLEQLARDVTAWDASVVEYFQRLATTQYMNHLRPGNLATPDLRQWKPLERLDTPFVTVPHPADVRRIESRRGKHNIPNVGIFLWRLRSYRSTRSPAFRVDARRYRFDALGKDTPIYNRPATEDQITHLAEPINVPMPISRRVLDRDLETYYGMGPRGVLKSILLHVNGQDVLPDETNAPLETLADLIRVCDLSDLNDGSGDWGHMPQDKMAIDPVLGRIAFPSAEAPPADVMVTYHYGFSTEMGGGEYGRAGTFANGLAPVIKVPSDQPTVQDALDQLAASGGVVEIEDNAYYVETPLIRVATGRQIELRAADEHRPVLLLDGPLEIVGGENAEVTLNGLLISGGFLVVPSQDVHGIRNGLRRLSLQHCTLVPGASPTFAVSNPGVPAQPTAPRLVVDLPNTIVEIDQCISGALRVLDGAQIHILNSIVDATAETEVAYAGLDGNDAGAPLNIQNSTVIGKVHTSVMELASNTIFHARLNPFDAWPAPVLAERLQQGCVRFSYLPVGSKVPRPFQSHPQGAAEAARVRPVFTSLRYGDAGYGQLSLHCSREIRQGADDEAEMGAFHNLYQPQRQANLRARLDEYLRFGLEAGIFFAS
jgi:hypothetical protein